MALSYSPSPPDVPRRSPLRAGRDGGATAQSARSLLNAAADLARNLGDDERLWTDCVLLRVGESRAHSGNVDGALRSAGAVRPGDSDRSAALFARPSTAARRPLLAADGGGDVLLGGPGRDVLPGAGDDVVIP
jgi:hypothetical protein